MRKILLTMAALLMVGTAFAQVSFTFNRTDAKSVSVTVRKNGEEANGVTATLEFSGAETLQTSGNSGTVPEYAISINRNTNSAKSQDPNKYTLTITNNSTENLTFDYIKVSNIALTGTCGDQGNTVHRQRNFVVSYGNSTLPSEVKYICEGSKNRGNNKKPLDNFFNIPVQTIEAEATYEITIAIDNDGISTENVNNGGKLNDGCFYGLTEIALVKKHTLSVGDAGYATLMLGYNASIPDNVKCYSAAVNGNYVTLADINDAVPAGTPVVVKVEEEGKDYEFVPVDYANAVTGNELKGTLSTKNITPETGKSCYVLSNLNGEVGFYKATLNQNENTAFQNNANKAYLPVANVNAARFLSFDFGTETAIEGVEGENGNVKTEIYDLAGRRVKAAQKGLYIVNGKVVIK